jgi:rsbT co-antagonist protein RsbR
MHRHGQGALSFKETVMNKSTEVQSLALIIDKFQSEILEKWLQNLKSQVVRLDVPDEVTRKSCTQFLKLLVTAIGSGSLTDIDSRAWEDVRQFLIETSEARAKQGSTPSDTATFVFSLKQSLFERLRIELDQVPKQLAEDTWTISTLLDKLGLFTIEVFQKRRDQIIVRQQQELLELSTPVVKLWHNILALPLIGTLDSARTQVVMENLLQKIIDTGAAIAIIDITGVPTVDTLVAQHLLKTIAAARLMGADCIISGIRPQIAQTIVHLGVNLEDVITKATLADAFIVALERTGAEISSGNRA